MPEQQPYYRPIRAAFQPRFTLGILYLFLFFCVFAMALVVPVLVDTYRHLPPGTDEEQLEIMREIARESVRPRLWIAIAASVFATALGAHKGVLPGMRQRDS